ncbi:DUF3231 family protein [Cytobacillus sp. FSL K6-0129]|uniref:DUF3231 family protein n=1 Tax=Cytobacillus sp. FSL K6-0129 TaxID=2921421 RepID=UPI0030F51B37
MSKTNYIPLTSSEIGSLWATYLQNSMAEHVLNYFLVQVQDPDIEPYIQIAYDISLQSLDNIKGIFTEEEIPIPVGFTEQDVNLQAPRLFDDIFFLSYLQNLGKAGMAQYSLMKAMSTRKDIRTFFSSCHEETSNLYDQVIDSLLNKGLLIRPPHIPIPNKVNFVEDKNYFDGISFIGKKRPLNVIEISQLFSNIQTNVIGVMLSIGFGQTAESQKVRDYMNRGKVIAKKHIKVFGDCLIESDLQVPMTWDAATLESTVPVFSDKLMMFHFNMLVAGGIGNYGVAASVSQRSDLVLNYNRLSAEIVKYANDGANIMIKNGWMEEVPTAINRTNIIKKSGNK